MPIILDEKQLDAVAKMKNGCILAADVGTGKSRTSLAYYYLIACTGRLKINGKGEDKPMKDPLDLYIITTAKKRDSLEWQGEMLPFRIESQVKVTVDSWNNISKYTKVYGAFFIFDEQRVVGYRKWTKSFLNIARKNRWILLSATPGDKWSDYIPVFVANGFYKNKTDFNKQHAIYSPFVTSYPKIEGYRDEGKLIRYRNDLLVRMTLDKHTNPIDIPVEVFYDRALYKKVWRDRWDPYENEPIAETGKLLYLLRKVVNSDGSRLDAVKSICESHQRVIVFYNYTYELNALRRLFEGLGFDIGEWNGEVHSLVPEGSRWAYLVQYSAGCEGWNCITTDTMIFYSQSYSYRQTKQAEGRIDRLNTPFKDLYYYKLKSKAPIDLAIARALASKKDFNERSFCKNGKV